MTGAMTGQLHITGRWSFVRYAAKRGQRCLCDRGVSEVSQKPANDQHALAGLGETLVLKLIENEKIYREVTQTGWVYNKV